MGFLSWGDAALLWVWNYIGIGSSYGYPHTKELGRGLRQEKGHVGGLFMSGLDLMPSLPSIGHEITKRGRGIASGIWQSPSVRSPSALYHLFRLPFVTGHGGTIQEMNNG